jgi:hypothetical protein
MRAKLFLGACCALLAFAAGAAAQTQHFQVTVAPAAAPHGYRTVSVSVAAIGSAQIRIWANAAIDPDCSAHTPGATLKILEPPAHGVAAISDEPYFAAYPRANPRSACNDRKIPGHQAFYTATAGYTGRDSLVLEGYSPEGQVRRINVKVDVR